MVLGSIIFVPMTLILIAMKTRIFEEFYFTLRVKLSSYFMATYKGVYKFKISEGC
jgi:hypothetical protein